ncbi:MAG: hypothetical protein Kow00121_55910 [Elainellaceae cyanobacterium]
MVPLSDAPSRSPLYRPLVVLLILAIAVFNVIPDYLTGDWAWTQVPELRNIQQLQTLQQQGITLPGWRTLKQDVVEIGGHPWSVQAIVPESTETVTAQNTIWLMLRPQTWHRDMPQVDWMDINGVQQWTADSQQALQFVVSPQASTVKSSQVPSRQIPPVQVEARFLRGWSLQRTYAVLQWYAWSSGGNAAPSRWFWVDQGSQWHDRRRTPWVAVSVLIPIKPLGDIETARSQAESLGQLIQSTLITQVLAQ